MIHLFSSNPHFTTLLLNANYSVDFLYLICFPWHFCPLFILPFAISLTWILLYATLVLHNTVSFSPSLTHCFSPSNFLLGVGVISGGPRWLVNRWRQQHFLLSNGSGGATFMFWWAREKDESWNFSVIKNVWNYIYPSQYLCFPRPSL